MSKVALFPGTFDPPSLGHLDIIKRAFSVADKVYVGVAGNAQKQGELFAVEERIALLKEMVTDLKAVEVVPIGGLVVEACREYNIDVLVRGLRSYSDLDYEVRMAFANRKMGAIETLFLMADERLGHISSTLIREIGACHGELHEFVAPAILNQVQDRFNRSR